MKKLSLFTIAYDPKTVNTLSSLPSHQKTTGLLRLSDPAKILDLVKNDNAPNHNNIEIIFDVLKRLETVILSKAGNHIYKISLTMLTKSTLKPIKKKAYDILIKSLDGPINTQFGLEIVLEQLSEEGFGEEYLQVVTKILTTLEVQAVELPGISPSNQILDLVLLSVQRFDYSDLYLLHLTTIIKLQIEYLARGINRLHLTAPDAKNQGMEICQNILNGNDRYSSSDILQSFNEINQVGDIYLGVQMVRFLLTSLSRPQQQLSEILSIIIPLFQTNHTWGLEGMLCLSTLCLENSPKLQKAILKLLEKALKDENDNCRFGATIALDIIGSLADGGVAAFARRLLTEIEIPSRGQHIGRSSRLFMIASTRILEIRRERKGVDESMLKYLQIKKRQ